MIRLAGYLVVFAALAGCERSTKTAPPDPEWVRVTLACVVRSTVEHANASRVPSDVATMAIEVWQRPSSNRRARLVVDGIARAAEDTGPNGLRAHRGTMLAIAAVAAAELGDLPGARALAQRAVTALGNPGPDRDYALQRAVEALAWTGDVSQAKTLAGTSPIANAAIALGMARAGDIVGAQGVLASSVISSAEPDIGLAGIVAMASVWSGDLVAARAVLARERDPDHRAMLLVWIADVASRSRHRDSAKLIDEAIAEVKQRARSEGDAAKLALTVWTDLVWFRDRLGSSSAARTELHDWLLQGTPGSLQLDLVGINVIRAEAAKLPAEADRLFARLAPPLSIRPEIELAQARGQFERAFDLFDAHRTDREQIRGGDSNLPGQVIDAIDAAEIDLWLAFTAAPRDPRLVMQFRKLVCK